MVFYLLLVTRLPILLSLAKELDENTFVFVLLLFVRTWKRFASSLDVNPAHGYRQLSFYQYSLQYLFLCSAEERNSGLEQHEGE